MRFDQLFTRIFTRKNYRNFLCDDIDDVTFADEFAMFQCVMSKNLSSDLPRQSSEMF